VTHVASPRTRKDAPTAVQTPICVWKASGPRKPCPWRACAGHRSDLSHLRPCVHLGPIDPTQRGPLGRGLCKFADTAQIDPNANFCFHAATGGRFQQQTKPCVAGWRETILRSSTAPAIEGDRWDREGP